MLSVVKTNHHASHVVAQHIRKSGATQITSHGHSMYPFIKEGDVCTFVDLSSRDIEPGDVVLFRSSDNRLIGHRVLKIDHDGGELTCKGDTNRYPDAKVSLQHVLGKLTRIQRNGRLIDLDTWTRRIWTLAMLRVPLCSLSVRRFLIAKSIWSHRIDKVNQLMKRYLT